MRIFGFNNVLEQVGVARQVAAAFWRCANSQHTRRETLRFQFLKLLKSLAIVAQTFWSLMANISFFPQVSLIFRAFRIYCSTSLWVALGWMAGKALP